MITSLVFLNTVFSLCSQALAAQINITSTQGLLSSIRLHCGVTHPGPTHTTASAESAQGPFYAACVTPTTTAQSTPNCHSFNTTSAQIFYLIGRLERRCSSQSQLRWQLVLIIRRLFRSQSLDPSSSITRFNILFLRVLELTSDTDAPVSTRALTFLPPSKTLQVRSGPSFSKWYTRASLPSFLFVSLLDHREAGASNGGSLFLRGPISRLGASLAGMGSFLFRPVRLRGFLPLWGQYLFLQLCWVAPKRGQSHASDQSAEHHCNFGNSRFSLVVSCNVEEIEHNNCTLADLRATSEPRAKKVTYLSLLFVFLFSLLSLLLSLFFFFFFSRAFPTDRIELFSLSASLANPRIGIMAQGINSNIFVCTLRYSSLLSHRFVEEVIWIRMGSISISWFGSVFLTQDKTSKTRPAFSAASLRSQSAFSVRVLSELRTHSSVRAVYIERGGAKPSLGTAPNFNMQIAYLTT
ncbi:unnamed protein product [Acanthosepion pharaonis]|uniref:Uncharacterized protein n=1 Tax=Acanthosepion pharaonis TaxID=158019 RepID=A0A812DMM9_ACAPH|nr:unnamed protein product [Sepia pharaonis]